MSEMVGIKLVGGEGILDGWQNVYFSAALGGWPLPERIAAFVPDFASNLVAVSAVEQVPEDYADKVSYYRKTKQSNLPESDPSGFVVRSAGYELETSS